MIFSQLSLNFWKEEYDTEWIIGVSNSIATQIVLNQSGQILLKGPPYSGKKHLATKVATMQKCYVMLIDAMNDIEIISKYDSMKANNQKVIWIMKEREDFANDVLSRFNAMYKADTEKNIQLNKA